MVAHYKFCTLQEKTRQKIAPDDCFLIVLRYFTLWYPLFRVTSWPRLSRTSLQRVMMIYTMSLLLEFRRVSCGEKSQWFEQ